MMDKMHRKTKQVKAYWHLRHFKDHLKLPFGYDRKAPLTDLSRSGVTTPPGGWLKECPRQLGTDENSMDSASFWGINAAGDVLNASICRRQGRKAEVWVYLKLSSGEEYQLPFQPHSSVYNTSDKDFSAAGLTFEVVEPLRRWRVYFNGSLRYSAYPNDLNVSLMSRLVANQEWSHNDFNISEIPGYSTEWHEQFGQLYGTVNIQGMDEITLILRGTKERKHGLFRWDSVSRFIEIKGLLHDGTAFTFYGQSVGTDILRIYQGQIAYSCGTRLTSVSRCKISNFNENIDKEFRLQYVAGDEKVTLDLQATEPLFEVFVGDEWECQIQVKRSKVTSSNKEGLALITYGVRHHGGCPLPKQISEPLLSEPDIENNFRLVTSFNNEECQSSKLVGGKGSSLALITSLKCNEQTFLVPHGICITKAGFDLYLSESAEVERAIKYLQDVAWENTEGSLRDECEKLQALIKRNPEIPRRLQDDLREEMCKQFGETFENTAFAVRSSGIGEDGKELSAAGQNETYLGVKSYDKIVRAIIDCWASQFSFRSVEYRRQNGQFINGGMGVVIQTMIPSEVAGVLFTLDPISGNKDRIVITSNYGLGESVVSALADPDIVRLKRCWNDELTIESKEIGKKLVRSIITDKGELSSDTRLLPKLALCSISDENAIKLGEFGIYLEKCFGDARDIEWAIYDGQIFILQCRPVTCGIVLSDTEVIHEFDTPPHTDSEYYSTANLAEVFPNSASSLTMTSTLRAHFCGATKIFNLSGDKYDPSFNPGAVYFHNHMFFDQTQQKAFTMEKSKSTMTKLMDISVYGRVIDDAHVIEKALGRFKSPPLKLKLLLLFGFGSGVLRIRRLLKTAEKKYRNYPVPGINLSSASEAHKAIGNSLADISQIFFIHIQATAGSTLYNGIILNILLGDSTECSAAHYTDFATLIGNANGAESGDIPKSLTELANAIAKDTGKETFCNLSLEDALQFLKHSNTDSSKLFAEFLIKHGHRCYQEFELRSLSWAMEPTKVVKILMDTVRSLSDEPNNEKTKILNESVLDHLQTPLPSSKRKILSWILSYSRRAVIRREQAKSLLIKYTDCIRQGYRHLANLMTNEGFLPDRELLFCMTHEEIEILLVTRSPRIIMRAKRRYRLIPYLDSLRFPEFIVGYPQPLNDLAVTMDELVLLKEVKGYPVCKGIVKGVARVIHSYEEVDTIQKGDILVTHSTDVAWSPYFPLLSGVVTEIGGLISHGAVIAREYNLPCIIGAENSTKIFISGETVLLNATDGKLFKIETDLITECSATTHPGEQENYLNLDN